MAPITESMVPSALPDWSALSRSASTSDQVDDRAWLQRGRSQDATESSKIPSRTPWGLNPIRPPLWPHRHVGFLRGLQYRRPTKRQPFRHLPTGLSALIRLHHTSPQPGSDPPPLPGGETNDGDVSVTRASSCTEVNNMLGLNRPRAPEGASN